MLRVKDKPKQIKNQWPILSVRVPPDVKQTLDSFRKTTNGKFQPTEFVRAALAEKFERDYEPQLLRKHGYIYLERRKKNQ